MSQYRWNRCQYDYWTNPYYPRPGWKRYRVHVPAMFKEHRLSRASHRRRK